jgi:hypothetical protein
MLEVQATGDKHPKTFVLKTDDADGELDRIRAILVDEVGVEKGEPEYDWFMEHAADQFKEGVAIPEDFAVDFIEMISNDWPQAEETVEKARQEAMREAGL